MSSNTIDLAPKGRTFVRGLIAHTVARSNPAAYASNRWGTGQADRIAKAAVPALTTTDIGTPEAREFFALVTDQSLIGRIQGLRRVAFNTRFTKQSQGAIGYWVAEANPVPLSKPAVLGSTLPSRKVAAIVTATKESVENMGAVVEAGLQRDLLDAVSGALDYGFINPNFAGVSGESPASVTYGQMQVASTGDARRDIEALFNAYTGSLRNAAIVMHPRTAVQIGLLPAQVGETKLTVQGGVLAGVPVFCTEAAAFDSNGGFITILDASAIAYAARDFGMETSTEAALIMSDTPTSPGEMVSLYDTNTVAWMAKAEASWEVQGTGRVVTITDAFYPVEV